MKIALKPESTQVLQSALAGEKWTQSDHAPTAIKRIYFAGKMLAEVIIVPDFAIDAEGKPVPPKQVEFDLTDPMFKCCQECLTWFIKEGRCLPGKVMYELVTTFDLYKE
tara:strand:- start:151 stop:477 length:327 start_codon:yes stop_codon:yes gene_type:complete